MKRFRPSETDQFGNYVSYLLYKNIIYYRYSKGNKSNFYMNNVYRVGSTLSDYTGDYSSRELQEEYHNMCLREKLNRIINSVTY